KDGVSQTPVTFTAASAVYTIPNLSAGNYTNVKVTNNGCASNGLSHVLTEPATATISVTTQANPSLCSGNDGTMTIGGLAPGTYTLQYMKNGVSQTPITFTASGTSYTVAGLTAGTYSNIRVASGGCTSN